MGRPGGGHGDAATGLETLGVADAVELQQTVGADAVAVGDFGDGFPRFHRVVAPAASPLAAAALAVGTAGGARHRQLGADLEALGILDAVELQQPINADAIASGDVRERFARLHHNLTRQPGQGQQQGQGQGDSGAAHGGKNGWLNLTENRGARQCPGHRFRSEIPRLPRARAAAWARTLSPAGVSPG